MDIKDQLSNPITLLLLGQLQELTKKCRNKISELKRKAILNEQKNKLLQLQQNTSPTSTPSATPATPAPVTPGAASPPPGGVIPAALPAPTPGSASPPPGGAIPEAPPAPPPPGGGAPEAPPAPPPPGGGAPEAPPVAPPPGGVPAPVPIPGGGGRQAVPQTVFTSALRSKFDISNAKLFDVDSPFAEYADLGDRDLVEDDAREFGYLLNTIRNAVPARRNQQENTNNRFNNENATLFSDLCGDLLEGYTIYFTEKSREDGVDNKKTLNKQNSIIIPLNTLTGCVQKNRSIISNVITNLVNFEFEKILEAGEDTTVSPSGTRLGKEFFTLMTNIDRFVVKPTTNPSYKNVLNALQYKFKELADKEIASAEAKRAQGVPDDKIKMNQNHIHTYKIITLLILFSTKLNGLSALYEAFMQYKTIYEYRQELKRSLESDGLCGIATKLINFINSRVIKMITIRVGLVIQNRFNGAIIPFEKYFDLDKKIGNQNYNTFLDTIARYLKTLDNGEIWEEIVQKSSLIRTAKICMLFFLYLQVFSNNLKVEPENIFSRAFLGKYVDLERLGIMVRNYFKIINEFLAGLEHATSEMFTNLVDYDEIKNNVLYIYLLGISIAGTRYEAVKIESPTIKDFCSNKWKKKKPILLLKIKTEDVKPRSFLLKLMKDYITEKAYTLGISQPELGTLTQNYFTDNYLDPFPTNGVKQVFTIPDRAKPGKFKDVILTDDVLNTSIADFIKSYEKIMESIQKKKISNKITIGTRFCISSLKSINSHHIGHYCTECGQYLKRTAFIDKKMFMLYCNKACWNNSNKGKIV